MMSYGPPVDLSFHHCSLDKILSKEPRQGALPVVRSEFGGLMSASLRLSNNRIQNLNLLPAVACRFLEYPEALAWLDLSCNMLTDNPAELRFFPGLRLLYLHGNRLTDLQGLLAVLRDLPNLYGLTLFGNRLPEKYRSAVLRALPHLKSLDFCNVSLADRQRAFHAEWH
ncbi:leucine-rich repeat-containing protein 51-like [Cloeon dipterum]